jgi:hypothetical protein
MRSASLAASCLVAVLAVPMVREDPPPYLLELEVDGQRHALVDGKQVTLPIAGKELAVKVSVAPTRRFDAAGVQFEYPRDMPFEYEESEHRRTWTLDGNDVTLMLFAHRVLLPGLAATTLQSMVPGSQPGDIELVLGGRAVAASTVDRHAGGTTFRHVAVDLVLGERSLLLMLQASLADDGEPTAEFRTVLELLAKTFRLAEAK